MEISKIMQLGRAANARLLGMPARKLKAYLLGAALLLALAAFGCSQGSYPVDIFYEMHYQQWYKSQEPPSLSAPASSVAWYPPANSTAFDTGEHLYTVNCSMCHGPGAKGDGPVVQMLKTTYGYQPVIDPPDLTDNPVENIALILGSMARPFGPDSVMPPYGKLLNDVERQAIAEYIATLSTAAPVPVADETPVPTAAPDSSSVEPEPAGAEPAEPEPSLLEASVNGDALEFDISSIEVVAGAEVDLLFDNVSGVHQHNLVIVQPGTKDDVATRGTTHPAADWLQPDDPDVIANVKLLGPGETGEVRFPAPPAGTYQFVCTFPGHNFTMFGDFVVNP